MPVYVVSFDVQNGSGIDEYPALRKAFTKLEVQRVMRSLYLVSAPLTAGALKQYLLNQMDEKDRIWVSRLPAKATVEFAYNAMGGTSTWLKKKHRLIELGEDGPGPNGTLLRRTPAPDHRPSI